jgi:GT2 family glycosyltransferase
MDDSVYDHVHVVICSYFSRNKLLRIIASIDNKFKILIIDNAAEHDLKKLIEEKFLNVEYFIPNYDMGLSGSYNYALHILKKKYIFITQPDVFVNSKTIFNLYQAAKKYNNFGILSSVVDNKEKILDSDIRIIKFNKRNKISNTKKNRSNIVYNKPEGDICVDAVTCTTMFINREVIKKIGGWDNNFFMYFEDMDLSVKVRMNNLQIIKVANSIVDHSGFSSHENQYNDIFEKKRNWHVSWSHIYFAKKYHSFISYYKIMYLLIVPNLLKMSFYLILVNKRYKMYFYRLYGVMAALVGLSSFYRKKN